MKPVPDISSLTASVTGSVRLPDDWKASMLTTLDEYAGATPPLPASQVPPSHIAPILPVDPILYMMAASLVVFTGGAIAVHTALIPPTTPSGTPPPRPRTTQGAVPLVSPTPGTPTGRTATSSATVRPTVSPTPASGKDHDDNGLHLGREDEQPSGTGNKSPRGN